MPPSWISLEKDRKAGGGRKFPLQSNPSQMKATHFTRHENANMAEELILVIVNYLHIHSILSSCQGMLMQSSL